MSLDNEDIAVTSTEYWDTEWSATKEVHTLESTDFYFGRRGIFMKMLAMHAPNLGPNGSIIEIGGGGANYRLVAIGRWLNVPLYAVEYSASAIALLNRLANLNGVDVKVFCNDIRTFSAMQSFDCVTHWGVLEHFTDPAPIISKSFDLLKPGGTLVFSMPNMKNVFSRYWRRWSPDNWSLHVLHEDQSVVAALQAAGFTDIRIFHFGLPTVKLAKWERTGPVQHLLTGIQKVISALSRVHPVWHRVGSPHYSMERGFSARRPIS